MQPIRCKHFVFAMVLTVVIMALAGCGGQQSASSSSKIVYLLLPDSTTARFLEFDQPNIIAAFKKYAPDIQVKVLNANNSASQQQAQFETALSDNAQGIILISADSKQAAGMLASASQARVPVVSYAHEAYGGPVVYHVSVPFLQIGEQQGKYMVDHLPASPTPLRLAEMYGDPKFSFYTELKKGYDEYLNPLIANGKVKVVCQADALLWVPANAQTAMEQCLTKTNNQVDAVLVMNDDTGGGVEAALAGQRLQGKVKLYGGYDATLEGVQRVLIGWQAADMSPPYKAMADAAARLLIAAMNKDKPTAGLVNGTFDNNFVKGGVPTAYIPNTFISPANVDETIVQAGIYTKAQLCTGLGAQSSYCK